MRMSLKKVSRKRVTEELGRGFDILSNIKDQGRIAHLNQNEYMREPPKAWDQICTKTQGGFNSQPEGTATPTVELLKSKIETTNYERHDSIEYFALQKMVKLLQTNQVRSHSEKTYPHWKNIS